MTSVGWLKSCLGAWMGPLREWSLYYLILGVLPQGPILHQHRDPSCTQTFENKGPILHPAIVKRHDPLFVTSLPGTHWVYDFLITQGGITDRWICTKYSCLEPPILEKPEILGPRTKVYLCSRWFFLLPAVDAQVTTFDLDLGVHEWKEPRTLNLILQTSDSKISNLKFHQICSRLL